MAQKTKVANELMVQLVELHTKNPNDMSFGSEFRKIVWQYIQDNSPAY